MLSWLSFLAFLFLPSCMLNFGFPLLSFFSYRLKWKGLKLSMPAILKRFSIDIPQSWNDCVPLRLKSQTVPPLPSTTLLTGGLMLPPYSRQAKVLYVRVVRVVLGVCISICVYMWRKGEEEGVLSFFKKMTTSMYVCARACLSVCLCLCLCYIYCSACTHGLR